MWREEMSLRQVFYQIFVMIFQSEVSCCWPKIWQKMKKSLVLLLLKPILTWFQVPYPSLLRSTSLICNVKVLYYYLSSVPNKHLGHLSLMRFFRWLKKPTSWVENKDWLFWKGQQICIFLFWFQFRQNYFYNEEFK